MDLSTYLPLGSAWVSPQAARIPTASARIRINAMVNFFIFLRILSVVSDLLYLVS